MTLTLTARDLDFLETLTRRVRLLTVRHALTIWWPGTRRPRNGRVLCIIESTGHYSATQIEGFHEHCAEYDLPYELW